ncbi:MAG: glycosyltransferase family 4 protein [Clostridia bacterium]|nr:glycosyltransferase family 4 protein [Clostridia bacterium]
MISNKKSILFIGGQINPIPAVRGGAVQTLVTALIDENEKAGLFDFTVCTGENPQLDLLRDKYKLCEIITVRKNRLRRAFLFVYRVIRKLLLDKLPRKTDFMISVNRKIRGRHFDAVIFETSLLELEQVKCNNDAKVFFHVHADFMTASTRRIDIAAEKCDYVIAVSDFIKSRVLTYTPFDNRVVTLKNAIDLELSRHLSGEEIRREMRGKLGYTDDDVVVLYCSRLSPEKGCLELIRAVKKVPQCKLLIVGGENFSSDRETEYVKMLREEAASFSDRVVFTGYVPHSDVFTYMCASDIGVVPSVCNEAASLTVLEMRSASLATVAVHRGGIPEYTDEEKSVFVEPGENFTDELAAAINRLVCDPELRQRLAQNATVGLDSFGYMAYYRAFAELMNEYL